MKKKYEEEAVDELLTSLAFCRVSGVMVKLTGVGMTLAFCGYKSNQDTVTICQLWNLKNILNTNQRSSEPNKHIHCLSCIAACLLN